MSEEQEKPKKKWHKSWTVIVAGLVIIGIIISLLVVWDVGNQYGNCCDSAYPTAREQMQNAVTAYGAWHNGSLPILNDTYTNANCSNCSVINISALLTANGGMLRAVPSGTNLSTSGNDNCGGNASLGCVNGSHYSWIVDTSGEVFSYCTGVGCTTNNSGYQGVWP
jgi:hypothetical protein